MGPKPMAPTIAGIKLSCTLGRAGMAPFQDDFPTVLSNAQWLQYEIKTPGFQIKRGFLMDTPGDIRLKFRHQLFEVSIT